MGFWCLYGRFKEVYSCKMSKHLPGLPLLVALKLLNWMNCICTEQEVFCSNNQNIVPCVSIHPPQTFPPCIELEGGGEYLCTIVSQNLKLFFTGCENQAACSCRQEAKSQRTLNLFLLKSCYNRAFINFMALDLHGWSDVLSPKPALSESSGLPQSVAEWHAVSSEGLLGV